METLKTVIPQVTVISNLTLLPFAQSCPDGNTGDHHDPKMGITEQIINR
jgi:hypothetical protein